MTAIQGKLFQLLSEFDSICHDLGIRYYVVGHQLLRAMQGKGVSGYGVDIAMFPEEFDVFSSNYEGYADNRAIESYRDNPNMPGMFHRYVDTSTLLLDLDFYNSYQLFGVAISIFMIRKDDSAAQMLLKRESEMSKIIGAALKSTAGKHIRRQSVKSNGIANRMLRNLAERKAGNCKTVLNLLDADPVHCPEGFWDEVGSCTILGNKYRTVSDPSAYLVYQYGDEWASVDPPVRKETYMCPRSISLPFRDYLDSIRTADYDNEFFDLRREYLDVCKNEMASLNAKEKEGWQVLFVTAERMRLRNRYSPMKEKLLMEWERGNHDYTMLLLGDYRKAVDEYMAKGIALCFDADIWEMLIEWHRENGRENVADALVDLVLPQHLVPIGGAC